LHKQPVGTFDPPADATNELIQAAGAHPLPDADSVPQTSLTTKDGEPMTMHVRSMMLTNSVTVSASDRWVDYD
jgi:hypothetical protein